MKKEYPKTLRYLPRIDRELILGWYKTTDKNLDGYINARLHQSDVPEDEKHPDFFIDKENKLKIYYIPYMSKTQFNSKLFNDWAATFSNLFDLIHFENFIIVKWYSKEDFQPVNFRLLCQKPIRDNLAKYINYVVELQRSVNSKILLVPRDYNSIYWFPKEKVFRIASIFDFELLFDNINTDNLIFCDEELSLWNITEKHLMSFISKDKLKKYLLNKGLKCIRS